ncbi:hypothetical protein [Streptomyces sp. KL116D]|uniref:hypothetical protein n=1 Tax=Streptomyces sp. KL116D TaxID=3045152 RepID=UPI003557E627
MIVEFQKPAAKKDSDFSSTPDRVGEGGLARAVRARGGRAGRRVVGAGGRGGESGAMKMPARLVGSMALLDLTVHAWEPWRGPRAR